MNFYIKIGLCSVLASYSLYFFNGWTNAKRDWQALARHSPLTEKVENRIHRKGIVKHLFYSNDSGRASLDIQARDSQLIVHVNHQGMVLHEEIEGVVGSFWDQVHNKAYSLFMPHALFDYPKKTFTGLDAQVQEFNAETSKFLGKGTFSEVECILKDEPEIHLRKVHAQIN